MFFKFVFDCQLQPESASFLFSNGPLQRPVSKGVGGRPATTIDPWCDIFNQKGEKGVVLFPGRCDLEPTWARFGAENGPRTHFSRFGVVFGRFWEDFGPFRMDFS